MTFESFLKTAWSEHAESPEDVAERIAASVHLVQASEQVAPFVNLAVHVYGEHLGGWQRGVALLESMRGLPAVGGDADADGAIARGVATLRYVGNTAPSLEALSSEDQVRVLATASSALVARGDTTRGIAAFTEALGAAEAGLSDASPGNRALAVGGNNLAAALEEKGDRTSAETQAMVAAAEAGVQYWQLAGTWLEHERAEYRLARSLLQAGNPVIAVASAKRCLALCDAHDAPAFERFFAHAVVALAHRAAGNDALFEVHRRAANGQYELIPEAERKWCDSELNELAA